MTKIGHFGVYFVSLKEYSDKPVPVNGYSVWYSEFPDHKFFVHRTFDKVEGTEQYINGWEVSEVSTGYKIPNCLSTDSKEVAVEKAIKKLLEIGKDTFDRAVKNAKLLSI